MCTLIASVRLACPDCLPIRDARAILFDNELLLDLSYTLAPFAISLGVIGWLVRALQLRALRGHHGARPR